jgi:hypothetical protein
MWTWILQALDALRLLDVWISPTKPPIHAWNAGFHAKPHPRRADDTSVGFLFQFNWSARLEEWASWARVGW